MKKILELLKKESGDAILTGSVLLLILLVLIGGFSVDIAKANAQKASIHEQAQQAVEIGIRQIDSRGGLTIDATYEAAKAYMTQDESKAWQNQNQCNSQTINGTSQKMPYMVFNLATSRALGTTSAVQVIYSIDSSGKIVRQSVTGDVTVLSGVDANGNQNYLVNGKYTVLQADIYDIRTNFFLGMFGMPCQNYHEKISAITFGSSQDLTQG